MAGTGQPGIGPEGLHTPDSLNSGSVESGLKEEQFHCPICNDGPLSRSTLVCHMTGKHNERLLAVCKTCQQRYPSDEIEAHVLRCKGAHVCPFCRATFACPDYLQRHITRSHSSSGRVHCSTCEKSFPSTFALTVHNRIHTGELPYACKLCNARFSQQSNLKFHLDSHHAYLELRDTPKPFLCRTCGRGFLFAGSLQNHRRQHMARSKSSDPFVCHVCTRQFAYRSELTRHLLVHTRKPEFACPFCQQLFRKQSHLKSHLLRHTHPNFLTCPHCLRTYASRYYLMEHIQKHEMNSETLPDAIENPDMLGQDNDNDCAMATVQEALIDEALLLKQFDKAAQIVSPNLNYLHGFLYGSENKGGKKQERTRVALVE